MLRKNTSPQIDAAVMRSVNFEVTIADMAKRSERRAWWVAAGSACLSLALVGGFIALLPLHEKIPYLVIADPFSGTSTLARLTDDAVNRRVTTNEAVNRSNIARFVLAREAFDVALTNMRDWPTVLTMAAPDVARPYLNLHSAGNETSPFKQYGRSRAVRVKILSIVLVGGSRGTVPKGATVRFQRTLYDKSSGATSLLDNKIATMEFVYKTNLKMDDKSRVENPLGFQVLSYRVDNDHGSAVPAAVPTAPGSAGMAASPQPPAAHEGAALSERDEVIAPGEGRVDQAAPAAQAIPLTTAAPASTLPSNHAANGARRR